MKLSKELEDALEAVSKEVESWPAWKRSIDLKDVTKPSPASEEDDQDTLLTRAAGA